MSRRSFITHPLVVRQGIVLDARDVTPRMRRVTIGGPGLSAFDGHQDWTAPGFDDHVKLIFASDGDIAAALPLQVEHGIEWRASETREARDYTPRAVRASDAGIEIDLDFVRHGDGPAVTWADAAAPGDVLWFVGPKSSTVLPDDLDWILLAADETGLPAIGRFLDERPTDAPARVVVTIEDRAAVQDLALREGDRLTWIDGSAEHLDDAVRDALADHDGIGYVWAAAESSALLPVRRFAGRELGIPKTHLNITGYWHRDEAHEGEEGAAAPVAEIESPVAWFAVRTALRLGLLDALADRPGATATDVAARIGLAPEALAVILPVLRSNAVISGDETLELGPLGEKIVDDEHVREEFEGLEAEAVLALEQLAPALQSGASPWAVRTGRTLAEQAEQDAGTFGELVHEAERLAFLLDGLVSDPTWQGTERVAFVGPGAVVAMDALREVHPGIRAALCESGPAAAVLLRDGIGIEDAGDAEVVVAALALGHRTDAEATTELARLAQIASRVVVIEESRADELGDHADEHELLRFARTGVSVRDISALAAKAGLRVDRISALGWGVEAAWLERVG